MNRKSVSTKPEKFEVSKNENKMLQSFDINKSLHKSHVTVIRVNETTLPKIDNIDPRDLYLISGLLDRTKTYFVSIKSGINPGVTRYQLNILLTLAGFAGAHVDIGNSKVAPGQRGLCKNDLYNITPYCSNYTLNRDLSEMLSKGLVDQWVSKTGRYRPRKTLTLSLKGQNIVQKFNDFYITYLHEVLSQAKRN